MSIKTWILMMITLCMWQMMSCRPGREQVPTGFWLSNEAGFPTPSLNGFWFSDSSFEYRVNPQYAINPLRSFGGHYELLSDSIQLRIEYYDIIRDFSIGTDPISEEDDNWAIVGGSLTRVHLPVSNHFVLQFKQSKDTICIDWCQVYVLMRDQWSTPITPKFYMDETRVNVADDMKQGSSN